MRTRRPTRAGSHAQAHETAQLRALRLLAQLVERYDQTFHDVEWVMRDRDVLQAGRGPDCDFVDAGVAKNAFWTRAFPPLDRSLLGSSRDAARGATCDVWRRRVRS